MNFAVAGLRARMSSTSSPSSMPAARLQLVAEHDLRLGVVDLGTEDELAGVGCVRHALRESSDARVLRLREELPRRADAPSGQRARDLDHVLLRVAAIDAERVQLHELASVILVQATRTTLRAAAGGNRELGTGNRRCLAGVAGRPPARTPGRRASFPVPRPRFPTSTQRLSRCCRPRSARCPDRTASPDSSRRRLTSRGNARARSGG